MPYFDDEITQQDIDYIFEAKPYVQPVDHREQFFAAIAARRPDAYQAMQQDNDLGVDTTYRSIVAEAEQERLSKISEDMQQELITEPVDNAKQVVDKYAAKANQKLSMRDYYFESQNIPQHADLEAARNILTEHAASIPTALSPDQKPANSSMDVLSASTPYAMTTLPGEGVETIEESKNIGKAQLGLLRTLPAFSMAWSAQAAKEVTGEQSFLYGNAVEALANHIYYSVDRAKAAEDVVASVRKHSGLLAENEFEVASMLELINEYIGKIDEGTTEDFGAKFQSLMLNTFAVLDMVPDFVPGMHKTVKANKVVEPLGKDIGKPLGDIAAHDKQAGDTLAAVVLQEPSGNAAAVLGTTKEQVAINAVPGFEHDGLRVAGQAATNKLEEDVAIALNTAADSTPASLLKFVDADKQQKELVGILQTEQMDTTLSVFKKSDDGNLRYGAVYGQSDGSAFADFDSALAASGRIRDQYAAGPFETEGVSILAKVGNGNTWQVVDKPVADATAYKVQLDVKQRMRWDTDSAIPSEVISPALIGTRYFQNIHATLASDYVVPLTASAEYAAKLQSDILKINEPLLKMNEFKKQGVVKAIMDGGEQERVFSDVELEAIYKLDKDQINAYHHERAMWDTIHHIKNREEYTSKLAEGYVRLQAVDEAKTPVVDLMGKAVDLKNFTGVEQVAMIDSSGVKVLSKAEAEALQGQGYQAYALADTYELPGDKRYKFIMAKPAEHVKPLPEQMLPYRKGYYYKINKGKYFIEKEFSGELNGVKHSFKRAVAIVDSPGAAEAAVKAGIGNSYKVDENIVNNHDFSNWIEINTPTTGYWYSKRQPQMPTYTLGLDGKLQRITSTSEDPIAAAEAAAAKVANFVSWRDTIKVYEQLHKNTYPELWTSDGARSLYLGTQMADNSPRIRAANAMFEHMTSLTSYASKVDGTWNNWMVAADRLFSNHRLGAHTSKLFLDAGVKANPARVLTSGVYYTQVASAPFRQFLLNVMTPTVYAGVAPRTWAKSLKEAYLVYAKLTGGHLPLRSVQINNSFRQAKGQLGDLDEVVRQFVKTGKLETVDSHAQLHNEMLKMYKGAADTKAGALFRETTKPLQKAVNFVRQQGVVKGELFNKVFSFVFAKNMHLADKRTKGLWYEKANLEAISNKANQLGLDMTKVGAYEYQAGLMRPLTQFLGVMHQAMSILVPRIPGIVRGNRAYDGKRAAVLLGLLTLWGAQGLPFSPDEELAGFIKQQLKDRGIDLSVLDQGATRALYSILLQGVLGTAIAETMRVIAQQDAPVQSEISATISPVASGANPFVERLITAEGNMLELLAGPSLTMIKNFKEAATGTRLMFYGYKPEELTTEKLKDMVQVWSGILPSMSNFMQATVSISYREKIDEYYNFNKREGKVSTNLGEQLLKAFVGIKPTAEQPYYEMLKDNKALEESAKQDLAALKGLYVRVAADEALTRDQKLDKIAKVSSVLSNNRLYNNKILDSLRIDLVNDDSMEQVVTAFIKGSLIDTPEKSIESTKRELERFFLGHQFTNKADQQAILDLVDTYARDAKAATELLDAETN